MSHQTEIFSVKVSFSHSTSSHCHTDRTTGRSSSSVWISVTSVRPVTTIARSA